MSGGIQLSSEMISDIKAVVMKNDPAAEKITAPALAEVADVNLSDSGESSSAETDVAVPANNLPETALKLPGVAEKDQPRFRRQMYRTDI